MLLSIFTPTYNRRNKLEQLYRSLKNQIDDECEWIIVDDGSTDATEKVILQFCNESGLQYSIYKEREWRKTYCT